MSIFATLVAISLLAVFYWKDTIFKFFFFYIFSFQNFFKMPLHQTELSLTLRWVICWTEFACLLTCQLLLHLREDGYWSFNAGIFMFCFWKPFNVRLEISEITLMSFRVKHQALLNNGNLLKGSAFKVSSAVLLTAFIVLSTVRPLTNLFPSKLTHACY